MSSILRSFRVFDPSNYANTISSQDALLWVSASPSLKHFDLPLGDF
jgi:hypothetical protein